MNMMQKNDIPIYEQSTKEQKANKPKIEDVCDYFLTDNILKEGMTHLLKFSNELKMKPAWFAKNAYKCTHKGKKVAAYGINGKDDIILTVSLAEPENLEKVILELSEDLKTELLNSKLRHCGRCSYYVSCDNGISFDVSGNKFRACSWHTYICPNPTVEQFKMIEKFIEIRRNNIKNLAK